MQPRLPFSPALFALDGATQAFEGYTCRQTWNGFEVPYFTKEQADIVCRLTNEAAGAHSEHMYFDAEADAYVMPWNGKVEDYEVFASDSIKDASGRELKVYSLGGGSWCWQLIENATPSTNRTN